MARHKEFEPDIALDRAMTLFWERGYEKTSMQDLVAQMAIGKRSMYDTFGDKHALYLKALERYIDVIEGQLRDAIDAAPDARGALRALFETAISDGTSRPRGCLAVNSATEVAPRDDVVSSRLGKHFSTTRQLVLDLVRQGQRGGEIATRQRPEMLATSLHNAWIGLRVQARAGVNRRQLTGMVDGMIAMLD
jgi:TetR/AcrR family transcriptional repressor of nem operon